MEPRFGHPGLYAPPVAYYSPPFPRVQDLTPSMNVQPISHPRVACPPHVSSASIMQPIMPMDTPQPAVLLHVPQQPVSQWTPVPKVVAAATNPVPHSYISSHSQGPIHPSVTFPQFVTPSPVHSAPTRDVSGGMHFSDRGWIQNQISFMPSDVIVPHLPGQLPVSVFQAMPYMARTRAIYHGKVPSLNAAFYHPSGNVPVRLPPSSLIPMPQVGLGAGNIVPIPMETGPPISPRLLMETQIKEEPLCVLDVSLELNNQSKTLREHLLTFVKEHYPYLRTKVYNVPDKPPVSQKQPDKLLVRAREGQYRVTTSIERVAHHRGEAVFLLSDYKHESFLKFFNLRMVKDSDQARIKERFNQFVSSKQFGDTDILVFHKHHAVLVFSVCSVSSNSDVQYIFKRLQKYRQQLIKSCDMMDKVLHFLGLQHCTATPILATPNLKRAFLAKVTPRDKGLHKMVNYINTLCCDELPNEFRTEWASDEHFQGLVGWWEKLMAETSGRGPNQEELEVLVGSFLCTDLSDAGFDQHKDMQPSEEKKPCFESEKQTITSKDETSPKTVVDLLSMSLSVGNVTKSFKQCMEEYVDLYFPNFMLQTYRVPPVHFNIQKSEHLADNDPYLTLNMPMSKDTRGDEGESRVISAIEILGLKSNFVRPVFIICDFQYNNYLNKLKESMFEKGDERRPQRAFGQSVRAQHDCLLIHQRYGIIIISVKAVGDNFQEWASSGNERWTAVKRTLGKVLKQLPREEKMVDLVLSDLMEKVPCHKLVALPNLTRQDIDTAISDDLGIKECVDRLFPGVGTGAFLCQDELCDCNQSMWEALEEKPDIFDKLCDWWLRSLGYGQDNLLPEDLCKQIIGRFCGLLSTVEVWTAQTPRVEVRSIMEAIQETSERFTCILLTPEQVRILNLESGLLFLSGPPGSGKTLILRLKAQRWAKEGNLVIININHGSRGLPLGHLTEQQLKKTMQKDQEFSSQQWKHSLPEEMPLSMQNGAEVDILEGMQSSTSPGISLSRRTSSAPSLVHVRNIYEEAIHRVDLDSKVSPEDSEKLREIPAGSYLIIDEVRETSWKYISWLLKNRSPKSVWCAGQYGEVPPPQFEKAVLRQIIRSPPMVQRVLKRTEPELGSVNAVMPTEWQETSAPHGLPTDGLRPLIIFHSKHDTSAKMPLDCTHCGQELADVFSNALKLVPPSMQDHTRHRKPWPPPFLGKVGPLTWKDIVIVCRDVDENCSFLKGLRSRGIVCAVIKDTSDPHVAMPEKDEIIFTTSFAMTGLERRVVVFVPFQVKDILTTDSAEGVEDGSRIGMGPQDDLKLSMALSELTAEDKVCLWYTASRCMGQLIIFIP